MSSVFCLPELTPASPLRSTRREPVQSGKGWVWPVGCLGGPMGEIFPRARGRASWWSPECHQQELCPFNACWELMPYCGFPAPPPPSPHPQPWSSELNPLDTRGDGTESLMSESCTAGDTRCHSLAPPFPLGRNHGSYRAQSYFALHCAALWGAGGGMLAKSCCSSCQL